LLARRLALNPRETSTAVRLAELDARRGQWSSAAALLAYADTIGVDDPRLLAELAQARLNGEQGGEATAAAQRAHALQRGNTAAAWILGETLRPAPAHRREADTLLAKARGGAGAAQLAER
jgi:hypothetical protein